MELGEYEQVKFKLAEIIRAASHLDAERNKGADERWRPLLARLAEDRFNVVVAGRFSQGKSTLMNALLGVDRLPTGLVPITSVLTTVRYGSSERVRLEYAQRHMPAEVPLKDLAMYVTEHGNPGNQRGIRMAEIQLRAEILRRGFYFVDTPGLGSAILANTETTQGFIPEIDVLIMVSSFQSALTEDEVRFLRDSAGSARSVFVVLNKHDLVPEEQRREVLGYAARVVREILGETAREPFSVSARDGLAAKQAGNEAGLQLSGIPDFERDLVEWLTASKAELFLTSMFERVLAAVRGSANARIGELAGEIVALRRRVEPADSESAQGEPMRAAHADGPSYVRSQPGEPCELCSSVWSKVYDFLRHYQYEISTRRDAQHRHAESGGFCFLHTWHYEQITSPRGISTAYPALLQSVAGRLRAMAAEPAEPEGRPVALVERQCPACAVRWNAEERGVQSILARAERADSMDRMPVSDLCIPHLQLVLRSATDGRLRAFLLRREAALLERTAEDMQRYVMRHDALKRGLSNQEERSSPIRALRLLVGDKQVNAPYTIEEII